MVDSRRRLRGLPGLCGYLVLAFALVPLWFFTKDRGNRRKLEKRFFARALQAVAVDVRVTGSASRTAGTLFLANHISFTDILALGLEIEASFVAKSDVRQWPVIGAMAERFDVVFVERDLSHRALEQTERIAALLSQQTNVVIFPEGTTSEGMAVLPFRSALLGAAVAAHAVQPVAIRYSDGAQRAYVGDESLLANLIRLAPHRAVIELAFLPPLPSQLLQDRKALAREARSAIATALTNHGKPSA